MSVINWIFTQPAAALVQPHVWEMLHDAVSKTLHRWTKIQATLVTLRTKQQHLAATGGSGGMEGQAVQRQVAELEDVVAAAQRQRDTMLATVVTSFVRVLAATVAALDVAADTSVDPAMPQADPHAFQLLQSRFFGFCRAFCAELHGVWDAVPLPADVDARVGQAVAAARALE